jgi:hypothetical protein
MLMKVPVFHPTVETKNMENMGSILILVYTGMRCITTFWPTTDRIYDGGPIIL